MSNSTEDAAPARATTTGRSGVPARLTIAEIGVIDDARSARLSVRAQRRAAGRHGADQARAGRAVLHALCASRRRTLADDRDHAC